jgi:hypothetical protein
MKYKILCAMVLLTAAMFATPAWAEDILSGTLGGGKSDEGGEVSTSDLQAVLKAGGVVLDVRSVKECAIAHIPGSTCMPGVLRTDGTYGDNVEQIIGM